MKCGHWWTKQGGKKHAQIRTAQEIRCHRYFIPATNLISRVTIFGALYYRAVLGGGLYAIGLSPLYTSVNVTREQPVPFSHRHHAGELGIDCRYCHTIGGEIFVCRTSADANLHDLPFADLDQFVDAGAGAGELPHG